MNDTILARQALRAALRARRQACIDPVDPISIYDFAERYYNLEVWFVDIGSLEGMYEKGTPGRIFISSHRPAGRQVLTCAHELGHHVFGHGTMVDEYLDDHPSSHNKSPEERLVNFFASHLMMPLEAIRSAFQTRQIQIQNCKPQEVYEISQYLGVSYAGLIQHMRWSLKIINDHHAQSLLKITPKEIKSGFTGQDQYSEVIIANECWTTRAIDLSVNDFLCLPTDFIVDENFFQHVGFNNQNSIFQANKQGISLIKAGSSDWCANVRISRSGFNGRNVYRHMEDPDDNSGHTNSH